MGGENSGRRPLAKERAIIEQAKDAWVNDQERAALLKKIESGRYSIWDMYKFKALIGDEKILSKFADKMLPDKLEVSSDLSSYLPPEVVKKAMERMKNEKSPL